MDVCIWSSERAFLVISAFACCAACTLLLLLWRRPRANLPPSPPALPVLGHLHLLGKLPHQSLHKLATKYGPFMHLRLGAVPTVVASSPDAANWLLKTHDHVFCSRPRTSAAVLLAYNRSDLAFAPYGSYWRQMRQICVTELFSPKRMEAFRPVREQEAIALVRSLWAETQAAPGEPVQVRGKLTSMAYNIICRMAFGERFHAFAEMIQLITSVLKIAGEVHLVDFLPFLTWLYPQGSLRRMRAFAKQIDALMQTIIDRRRAERKARGAQEERDGTDFLDALLSVASSGSDITDDNIKAVLFDMFVAGTDTSSVTAEWGLAEIVRSPSILARLEEELDAVVGKERLMQESDIPRLPFLQAVVKEVMRLHPPGPLLVPHESMRACDVAGFHVPANTRAIVNVWAIGRDENVWERPLEFVPERFEGEGRSVNVQGQHFQLLPFGAGRRSCPGWSLGLTNVHLMVGVLVHAFEWSSTQRISMHESFGLNVCMTHPLLAMATPRLSPNLYVNSSD